MSITWRIKIYDEEFTSRTQPGKVDNILTPADAFASLDSFDVDGAGNCLEARFRAVPSLVDIRPRDIVILEVSEDGGSTFSAVYRGYIVVAGNKRSKSLEAFKATGLKQRFYEKINPIDKMTGADIATMADEVFDELVSDSYMPDGVNTASFDAPAVGFSLGFRLPQLETVGATFDYLAEQAGAFVVASGSSYTYDGVTYGSLEAVPAVMWGVDANGDLFFRRPQVAAITAAESDTETIVRYEAVESETAFDSVQLIFATDPEESIFDEAYARRWEYQVFRFVDDEWKFSDVTFEPLSRRYDIDGKKHTRLVVADDPVALMLDDASSVSASGTVSNASNAIDGDDNTFASVTSGTLSVDRPFYAPFIARIKFRTTSATNSVDINDNLNRWRAVDLPDDTTYDLYLKFLLPLGPVSFALPSLLISGMGVWRVSGANIDVFTMESLVPAVDLGGTVDEDYARRFLRTPETNVAQVSQYGNLGGVSQTMTFTPAGESAIDVPVERIEYTLTTREGLVTTYHLGQAYDAELLSERAVLEALAQRATR